MRKWIKYSGISININLNPCHWYVIPFVRQEHNNEWGSPWGQWRTGWLFFTVLLYLDDGSW